MPKIQKSYYDPVTHSTKCVWVDVPDALLDPTEMREMMRRTFPPTTSKPRNRHERRAAIAKMRGKK